MRSPSVPLVVYHKTPPLALDSFASHTLYVPLLQGSLAQLVEQLTFNQLVRGSSPRRPTSGIKGI